MTRDHPAASNPAALEPLRIQPVRAFRRLAGLALLSVLGGCAWLAVATAPAKVATPPSEQARAAADRFWELLHAGRYDGIDAVIEAHMQVLVREPNDALTLAHTGWLHAWKLSERSRVAPSARIAEHATLARRYFDEAVLLAPEEARYLGFAASFAMAEANILNNEAQMRRAYYRMKDAVARWPEFNLFTSGYTMSGNPPDSAPFREGLAQQWETLDRCFGETVSRNAPVLDKYMALEVKTGPKRACWNSWIAPHNFEGFFLNFGDMLARSNDLPNARAMYQAARLPASYASWPYRDVLERRLARLDALPALLNRRDADDAEWVPMVRSRFACMGCHQRG